MKTHDNIAPLTQGGESPTTHAQSVDEAMRRDAAFTGVQMTSAVLAAQMAAAVVLFFVVRDSVPPGRLWLWSGYHLAMITSSMVMAYFQRDLTAASLNIVSTERALAVFAMARSVSWSLAAFLFFPSLDMADRGVFMALLCALCIGATTTSIAYFPAFVAFVLGALVPVSVLFIFDPDSRMRILGAGFLVGWGLVLLTGRRLHNWLADARRKKFELELTTRALREEQKRAESARERAELAGRESDVLRRDAERASSDKTRFLAAASHDLRQPMHSLALFLEAARARNKDREVDGLLQKVDASVRSLDALFESLLDISRLDSQSVAARKSRFPLQPLLDEIESRFAGAAAEKRLSLRVRPTSAWVLSDASLLERVLSNLVANAIRYTQRGGVLLGVRMREGRLSIEVWDTGIGIPSNQFESVFQEFVQLDNPERDRRKGLGLGLAIVQRLSTILDHPIALQSRVERGTKMAVSVPVVRAPAPTHAPPLKAVTEAQSRDGCASVSVLLIDDEVAALEATMTALESAGCEVYPAVNARDAFATAKMQLRSARPRKVIVSDFRLGQSEYNGLELIEQLRAQAPIALPAVLLTGDVALFDAMGTGTVLAPDLIVLAKPASSAQITQAIRRLIA